MAGRQRPDTQRRRSVRRTSVRRSSLLRHSRARRPDPDRRPAALADTSRVVAGSPEEDRFAIAFVRDEALVGAAAVNSPKDLIRVKRAISAGERLDALA
ncbi:oxidoreductase C-terminal domain-containing protein [Nonomuraea sp. NPDC050691]|uniref:oxidoreductase C-terminal domain-containing protein n=1 Tax=Nonomuraea sp. NPDC050691 TaxID=3155661 RepID=UPI00340BF6C1